MGGDDVEILVSEPQRLAGDETLLVLATRPSDETFFCGGLIAESCRRGRPPFVAVMTDGHSSEDIPGSGEAAIANRREQQVRKAVKRLGLPDDNLNILGLFDGTVPSEGTFFETLVEAVRHLMWRRDCNVICAPSVTSRESGDRAAAGLVAREVARRSGVGLLMYPVLLDCESFRATALLDVRRHRADKWEASAAFGALAGQLDQQWFDVEPFADETTPRL